MNYNYFGHYKATNAIPDIVLWSRTLKALSEVPLLTDVHKNKPKVASDIQSGPAQCPEPTSSQAKAVQAHCVSKQLFAV